MVKGNNLHVIDSITIIPLVLITHQISAIYLAVHMNKSACGAPILVGPPGKCPLGPYFKTALPLVRVTVLT